MSAHPADEFFCLDCNWDAEAKAQAPSQAQAPRSSPPTPMLPPDYQSYLPSLDDHWKEAARGGVDGHVVDDHWKEAAHGGIGGQLDDPVPLFNAYDTTTTTTTHRDAHTQQPPNTTTATAAGAGAGAGAASTTWDPNCCFADNCTDPACDSVCDGFVCQHAESKLTHCSSRDHCNDAQCRQRDAQLLCCDNSCFDQSTTGLGVVQAETEVAGAGTNGAPAVPPLDFNFPFTGAHTAQKDTAAEAQQSYFNNHAAAHTAQQGATAEAQPNFFNNHAASHTTQQGTATEAHPDFFANHAAHNCSLSHLDQGQQTLFDTTHTNYTNYGNDISHFQNDFFAGAGAGPSLADYAFSNMHCSTLNLPTNLFPLEYNEQRNLQTLPTNTTGAKTTSTTAPNTTAGATASSLPSGSRTEGGPFDRMPAFDHTLGATATAADPTLCSSPICYTLAHQQPATATAEAAPELQRNFSTTSATDHASLAATMSATTQASPELQRKFSATTATDPASLTATTQASPELQRKFSATTATDFASVIATSPATASDPHYLNADFYHPRLSISIPQQHPTQAFESNFSPDVEPDVHICRCTTSTSVSATSDDLESASAPRICGATFTTAAQLQDHLISHHVKPLPGPKGPGFYCTWHDCHRPHEPFSQKSKLQGHFLTHSNHKGFQCTTCGKAFARQATLERHERSHKGLKPYRCEWCGKRFTDSSELKTHIRTHTGEKPFKCEYPGCTFQTGDSSNMSSHKLTHGERKHKCPFPGCVKSFTRPDQLKRHMRTTHKDQYSGTLPPTPVIEKFTAFGHAASPSAANAPSAMGIDMCVPTSAQTQPAPFAPPSWGVEAAAVAGGGEGGERR